MGASTSPLSRDGCRERRRCSRDTYPESYITKYASIQRETVHPNGSGTNHIQYNGFQPQSRQDIGEKIASAADVAGQKGVIRESRFDLRKFQRELVLKQDIQHKFTVHLRLNIY